MRGRGEQGVTLLELIVVIMILGVIVPVITASIVVGLQAAEGTADRVDLSHDAKLTGIYMVPDIQSAETVTLGSSTCTNATGTKVVTFGWDEEGTAVVVSYVADMTAHTLVRTVCRDAVQIANQTVTVAHNISDTPVSTTCSPNCAAPARTVTTVVEVCGRLPSGPAANTCRADTTYSFTVSARSRVQV
jgi:prepilin-type N-terminal cleavage/methylation domain-containing protein